MKTKKTPAAKDQVPTIYDLLKGGDLRSIGKSDEVVKLVTSGPVLFDEVFQGIVHEDVDKLK
jgi:hypothetical protein